VSGVITDKIAELAAVGGAAGRCGLWAQGAYFHDTRDIRSGCFADQKVSPSEQLGAATFIMPNTELWFYWELRERAARRSADRGGCSRVMTRLRERQARRCKVHGPSASWKPHGRS
jgi:hypothetical protein